MIALLNDMNSLEKFFFVCAVLGGVLFVIRLILQFVGGDGDFDGDFDGDVDMDADADFDGGDSDISFKILSFQGLTSFFMMFGLVGLALMRESEWGPARSIVGASAAGVVTVWIMKLIFDKAKGLQSSGTIDMNNAIGQEGEIYLTIPPTGTGKVRVSVQDHLKVFEAMAQSKQEIKTGERIRVVRIISNNVLVVEKID